MKLAERVWTMQFCEAIQYNRKLPRKLKKFWLGRKENRRQLNALLDNVKIIPSKKPGYLAAEIKPFEFCPKCGCSASRSTENLAGYPECYIQSFCARCGFLVAVVDNSPRIHCLTYKEFKYEL